MHNTGDLIGQKRAWSSIHRLLTRFQSQPFDFLALRGPHGVGKTTAITTYAARNTQIVPQVVSVDVSAVESSQSMKEWLRRTTCAQNARFKSGGKTKRKRLLTSLQSSFSAQKRSRTTYSGANMSSSREVARGCPPILHLESFSCISDHVLDTLVEFCDRYKNNAKPKSRPAILVAIECDNDDGNVSIRRIRRAVAKLNDSRTSKWFNPKFESVFFSDLKIPDMWKLWRRHWKPPAEAYNSQGTMRREVHLAAASYVNSANGCGRTIVTAARSYFDLFEVLPLVPLVPLVPQGGDDNEDGKESSRCQVPMCLNRNVSKRPFDVLSHTVQQMRNRGAECADRLHPVWSSCAYHYGAQLLDVLNANATDDRVITPRVRPGGNPSEHIWACYRLLEDISRVDTYAFLTPGHIQNPEGFASSLLLQSIAANGGWKHTGMKTSSGGHSDANVFSFNPNYILSNPPRAANLQSEPNDPLDLKSQVMSQLNKVF